MADTLRRGDKAFRKLESTDSEGIDLFRSIGFDRMYIDAYKAGADTLLQAAIDANRQNAYPWDTRIIPAVQGYRHYLELQFKYILILGRKVHQIEVADSILDAHAIYPLWNTVKTLLPALPLADNIEQAPVESIIQEFHNSDPSGQEWRYHRRKDKQTSLQKVPPLFDLENLYLTMGKVGKYLDTIVEILEFEFDDLRER